MQFAPAHAKNRFPRTVPILNIVDTLYQYIIKTDVIRITVLNTIDNAFRFTQSLPYLYYTNHFIL